MRYLTKEEIAKVDDLAINKYGVQIEKLMENAGRQMARFVSDEGKIFPNKKIHKIVVIYGKGNNGGDGLVCARHLSIYGFDVEIVGAVNDRDLNYVSRKELRILKKMGIKTSSLSGINKLGKGDLIIDSLLGYNLKGDPKDKFAELIRWSNEARKKGVRIISFDLPSGIDATTGKESKPSIKADYVLTLAMPKKGLKKMKNIYVANIGIPNEVYKDMGIKPISFKKSDIVKVS